MDLGLKGRRALVTGASTGLGLGCAQALAAEGAVVTLVSRSAEKLAAAAATIPTECHTLVGDLGEVDGVPALVAEAERSMGGGIDIVIANAGGPPVATFTTGTIEAFEPALRQNLLATVALCYATVPSMRERRWGRVVAITSIGVRQPIANLILSNTARTGLTAFLKTLANEVIADGVTVNSLQPNFHLTDRLRSLYGDALDTHAERAPAKRFGSPDDFGRIAAFLCSESANYLTGAAIPVDGGSYLGLQ